MSDKPGRDARGRPGIGTTRQPRQPAQQPQPDDGSQSTDSASGAQSPPRPTTGPALRGTNVNTGPSSTGPSSTGPSSTGPSSTGPSSGGPSSSGFRAARPVQGGKPQPSVAFSPRNRPQAQPQPQNQTGADAASSTSLADDDEDDAGQTTTTTTTTTVPQPTAKPAQTGGFATRPRTGLGPGRAANPIPMMARGRAQARDRREDEAALDADVETKDADLDTLVRDPGSEADDEPDTSSESSEAKQPATKVPSGRQQPDDSTTTTTTTTTTPINTPAPTQSISTDDSTTTTTTASTSTTPISTPAPTQSISTDDSTTTTTTASTSTTPINTPAPTQSISTSTEAKSTAQDPRRAAFQQQRRVAAKVLAPDKRAWGNDLAKVLHLPIPSSQTRLLNEGLATAGQIAGSNAYSQQDQQAASQHEQALRAAGNPPWGADTAMQAADAKVQLDLLSIPPNNRRLSPLSADLKGVNKTFWVENVDAGGTKTKAFLCKPASDSGAETMPSGGKPGGEVAREALAGRAAQFLLGKGLDIGMPETHVVKLSGSLLPGNPGAAAVTCSVQQFGASVGQIGTQSRAAKGLIDGKKVAALGVFDMMTLANDRHGGNILLGPNGELIPIDHGENFTETTDPSAAARLKTTLGGVGNALLAIPSAHDPMPREVAAAAASVNPGELRATLTADRDAVAARHGDMKGMISDAAIESAERAGQFTKLAAKMDPAISVAAAQVALGTHVNELLDPTLPYGDFSANARRILAAVAKQQGAIKEVCLSSNTDYELLCREAGELGWRVQRRGEATVPDLVSDPMAMMAILANQTKIPPASLKASDYPTELQFPEGMIRSNAPPELRRGRRDFEAKLAAIRKAGLQALEQARDSVDEQAAGAVLLRTRKRAVVALLPLIPANQRQAMQTRAAQLDAGPANAVVAGYRDLSGDLTDLALAEQQRRFKAVEQRFRLDLFSQFADFNGAIVPSAYLNTFNELTAGNVLKGEPELVTLESTDLTVAKIREAVRQKFSALALQFDIPSKDPDLVAFAGNLQQGDLGVMFGGYKKLRDRIQAGAFQKKT
jgi:hypothetical protein